MASPSDEDSTVTEFCTNQEAVERNLCTQPNLPSESQQPLDSTDIEFHTNKDSYASDARSLLALKALSPDIPNRVTSVTQTSLSTVIVSPTNEDVKFSITHSQCIPLKQEQLREHFSETHTAINTSSPKIPNSRCEIQTSQNQDNNKDPHSNFKNTAHSTSSISNPQRPMNFYDQTSTTEHCKQPPFEMMLREQITAASRTDCQDVPIDLSVSSSFRSRLPQSVPENLISDRNSRDIWNPATNYSAELFRKRANPSTETFFLQHGAQSSEKPNIVAAENHPTVHAPLPECSDSPTTNLSLESGKCTIKFTNENSFSTHAHEKQSPNVFRHESIVREHCVTPVYKWPFKCDYCEYAAKIEKGLKSHLLSYHASEFSTPRSIIKSKCLHCFLQFIEESKDNDYVQSDNCDSNVIKCDSCTAEFPCEHKLISHYNKVHKVKRFKCDKCPFASTLRQNLTMHQNAKHKNDCFESLQM